MIISENKNVKKEGRKMSMISPQAYVSQYKDCTLKKMIKEKNSLQRELKRLEKLISEKDYSKDEWSILPSPETRFETYCEYPTLLNEMIGKKMDKEIEIL